MGSKDNYDYLVDYLADHGYVCIQPSHEDALKAMPPQGRMLKAREIIRSLPANSSAWDNRAKDISFIIDSLAVVQKQLPVSIDPSRIACGGHSLGAFTTALIIGAEPPSPATRKDYLDKRISAALLMSPQVVRRSENDFGFGDLQAWKRLTVPCLFLSGHNDTTQWATFEERKQSFLNCPAGNKFFATIQGASHMTFAGRDKESRILGGGGFAGVPQATEGNTIMMTQEIDKVSCCFLDAFMKHDARAMSLLNTANAFGNLVYMKSR